MPAPRFTQVRIVARNLLPRREAVFQGFFLPNFIPNVRYAEGEFSKRAIINGKTDLVRAEA